jgi:hypothetical protein
MYNIQNHNNSIKPPSLRFGWTYFNSETFIFNSIFRNPYESCSVPIVLAVWVCLWVNILPSSFTGASFT